MFSVAAGEGQRVRAGDAGAAQQDRGVALAQRLGEPLRGLAVAGGHAQRGAVGEDVHVQRAQRARADVREGGAGVRQLLQAATVRSWSPPTGRWTGTKSGCEGWRRRAAASSAESRLRGGAPGELVGACRVAEGSTPAPGSPVQRQVGLARQEQLVGCALGRPQAGQARPAARRRRTASRASWAAQNARASASSRSRSSARASETAARISSVSTVVRAAGTVGCGPTAARLSASSVCRAVIS